MVVAMTVHPIFDAIRTAAAPTPPLAYVTITLLPFTEEPGSSHEHSLPGLQLPTRERSVPHGSILNDHKYDTGLSSTRVVSNATKPAAAKLNQN